MTVHITYFVHGTTTDNGKGLATGWAGGELSDLGKKQAKELGLIVSDKQFDAIFCSDLKRAVDSANLGFAEKYSIIQDERLRECNYGDFNQKPEKEFQENLEEHIEKPFTNGESLKDVEIRVSNFLDFLSKNYEGKHIAILAHRFPQLALDVLIKGKSWKQALEEDWRKTKSWQPGWDYFLDV